MFTNNHVPNFRCLPTFLLFIVMKSEKKVGTLVLLCITKKKLLIKFAYLSKLCYRTSSCDPQSKVARRRYVVKHNLITEVYLMNVENNYMFRPVLAIIRLSMELEG